MFPGLYFYSDDKARKTSFKQGTVFLKIEIILRP